MPIAVIEIEIPGIQGPSAYPNVLDFGAKGDGVTDDYVPFVNGLVDTSPRLHIPGGKSYLVDLTTPGRELVLPAGKELFGDGATSILLVKQNGSSASQATLFPWNNSNTKWRNFKIVVVSLTDSSTILSIFGFGRGTENHLIENIDIDGGAVNNDGSSKWKVFLFTSANLGLGCDHVMVKGGRQQNCTWGPLKTNTDTSPFSHWTFKEGSCENFTGAMMQFNSPKGVWDDILVSGWQFKDMVRGLGIVPDHCLGAAGASNLRVLGNFFQGRFGAAMHFEGPNPGLVVSANQAEAADPDANGIFLTDNNLADGTYRSVDGALITDNRIVGKCESVVTISIASPAVIGWVNHRLTSGQLVKFTTTGALPTGINAGVYYYVQATGLSADSFRISATSGGGDINTSGSQSGVHTAKARSRGKGIWLNTDISDTAPPAVGSIISGNNVGRFTYGVLTTDKGRDMAAPGNQLWECTYGLYCTKGSVQTNGNVIKNCNYGTFVPQGGLIGIQQFISVGTWGFVNGGNVSAPGFDSSIDVSIPANSTVTADLAPLGTALSGELFLHYRHTSIREIISRRIIAWDGVTLDDISSPQLEAFGQGVSLSGVVADNGMLAVVLVNSDASDYNGARLQASFRGLAVLT